MFHQDQKHCVVVNYSLEKVFDAILKGAESLSGFSVKSSNRVNHSISINVGMSLFSWGEQMIVSLNDLAAAKTEIVFTSGSKIGTEFVSNTKNLKNIDNLMNAMSKYLVINTGQSVDGSLIDN